MKDFRSILINDEFTGLTLIKIRRLIAYAFAEMIATMIFVGIGCASVVPLLKGEQNGHIISAMAFALAISASIVLFNHISGSLMNPALTIGLVILGHFSVVKALYYIFFQLLGGFLGVLIIKVISPNVGDQPFCMTRVNPEISVLSAFVMEFFTTSILAMVLCNVVDPLVAELQRPLIFAKFLVTILAIAMVSPKYAGCSMNPARSFGAALLAWEWENHWIYWFATIGGTVFTTVFYRIVFAKDLFLYEEEATTTSSTAA